MIVVDSSALVSILLGESDAQRLGAMLSEAPRCLIATPTLLESTIVMVTRLGVAGVGVVQELVYKSGIEVVPFDAMLVERAIQAFLTYGKGRHPA